MDTTFLENMGLAKREATLYIALLETGSTTIGALVSKTDIPSSKIYDLLNRLIDKGLAGYVIRGKRKYFEAADPIILSEQFSERKKEFDKHLEELKTKKKLAQNKEFAQIYYGKNAIFSLLRHAVDLAKPGSEYLSFSVGIEHNDKEISTFLNNLAQRRIEKNMKIKVLSPESKKEIIEKAYSKDILKKINNKYTKVNYPQGMIILENTLILLDWSEPVALMITNMKIVENFRSFFYGIYSGKN
jgi:sugar-specific transcriptional regulator TrmB